MEGIFQNYHNEVIIKLTVTYFFQLKELTPQVSHVAKILLDYGKYSPSDVPAVSVHFDSMRDNWKDKMQTLTNLVDSATDTGKFIEACGMSLYFFLLFQSESGRHLFILYSRQNV